MLLSSNLFFNLSYTLQQRKLVRLEHNASDWAARIIRCNSRTFSLRTVKSRIPIISFVRSNADLR